MVCGKKKKRIFGRMPLLLISENEFFMCRRLFLIIFIYCLFLGVKEGRSPFVEMEDISGKKFQLEKADEIIDILEQQCKWNIHAFVKFIMQKKTI